MADLAKENLYELLDVDENADKKQILSAYRKKARKCHPDKNPDNPKAAEEFHRLSKALELLTDAAARAAYDKLRQARKAAEARTRGLDSKRRKLKEDLEAREQAAQAVFGEHKKQYDNKTAEAKLLAEIERLRKEGSSILKQEQAEMRKQMRKETADTKTLRIRLRWNGKAPKQYTQQELEDIFSKHGNVVTILLSAKKSGSALLEFEAKSRVKSYLHEIGSVDNPLKVLLIGGQDTIMSDDTSPMAGRTDGRADTAEPTPSFDADFESGVLSRLIAAQRAKEAQGIDDQPATDTSENVTQSAEKVGLPPNLTSNPLPPLYESVHAANARRQAERQRLIEQMMKEDEES